MTYLPLIKERDDTWNDGVPFKAIKIIQTLHPHASPPKSAVSNAAHRRHNLKPCTSLAELCSSPAQKIGLGFRCKKYLEAQRQSREYQL